MGRPRALRFDPDDPRSMTERVQLYRPVRTRGPRGNETISYDAPGSYVTECFAEVRTPFDWEAQSSEYYITHTIRIYAHVADVRVDWQVRWKGRRINLRSVLRRDPRSKFIRCIGTEEGAITS